MRATGDVFAEVVDTFTRDAPEVIEAEFEGPGGRQVLVGTPNHPFWVPAVGDYVPLGDLEVGAVLHVHGGGEAILVSKTWRQGDFEGAGLPVFDFEVEGLHNFYVRGEGADAAGVLVHNSTGLDKARAARDTLADSVGGNRPPPRGNRAAAVVGGHNTLRARLQQRVLEEGTAQRRTFCNKQVGVSQTPSHGSGSAPSSGQAQPRCACLRELRGYIREGCLP